MTFKEQIRWCGSLGLLLLLPSVAIMRLAWAIGEKDQPDTFIAIVFFLGLSGFSAAFFLLAFGVAMRSGQRWLYLQSSESLMPFSSMTIRQRLIERWDAVLWCWWLHIDRSGNDRDD